MGSTEFGAGVPDLLLDVELVQALVRLELAAETGADGSENAFTSHWSLVDLTVDCDCWV